MKETPIKKYTDDDLKLKENDDFELRKMKRDLQRALDDNRDMLSEIERLKKQKPGKVTEYSYTTVIDQESQNQVNMPRREYDSDLD